MNELRVLVTDRAWPDLSIESNVLSPIGVELVEPKGTDEASLIQAAVDCVAIMTNWAATSSSVIDATRDCRLVARMGIGLDNIDVGHCTRSGIPVTNVPDYCVAEVAEHTLALLLALARKVAFYHRRTQAGVYQLQEGPAMHRLNSQVLGLVGYGRIGRRVAQLARGFGMQVLVTSRHRPADAGDVEWTTLDDLLARSDFVSLHLPLTEQTRELISERQFERMKTSAYLINTARGGIVDRAALAAALANDRLAGAALDVQTPEPPDLRHPPYDDPRVIVTPHAAFVSEESLADLRRRVACQVRDVLGGTRPENVINPQVFESAGLDGSSAADGQA